MQRYREALGWVVRDIGDQPVTQLHLGHLLALRRKNGGAGCGEARMASIGIGLRAGWLSFSDGLTASQLKLPPSVRPVHNGHLGALQLRRTVSALTRNRSRRARDMTIRGRRSHGE
jgi:hypothetical protein